MKNYDFFSVFCVSIPQGTCICFFISSIRRRPSATPPVDSTPVLSLLTYSKGFICSAGNGTLYLFEKTDEKCLFKKARSVNIELDPSSSMDQAVYSNEGMSNEIVCLALSPSEENVVCSTQSQQLFNLTLSATDIERVSQYSSYCDKIIAKCIQYL